MKKDHHLLRKFSTSLQIFIVLFVILGIAAADDSNETSDVSTVDMPIVLSGDISVNGEPADVGTIISVELDGKELGSTEVTTKGVYGDKSGNKLLITCDPEDYDDLEFYINGKSVSNDPVINSDEIDSDGFLSLSIDANVAEGTSTTKTSGGGGGAFGSSATTTEESESESLDKEESSISGDTNDSSSNNIEDVAGSSAHEEPFTVEDNSKTMLIIICGLGLLLVVGYLIYNSKKKPKE